jgi:hypothetical protein
MEVEVVVAIIAGGAALLGSAVTGVISYVSVRQSAKVSRLKESLIQANRDIASLYHLEELYCTAIADSTKKTREGVKRAFRKQLRYSLGKESPSSSATANQAEQRIRHLT